MAAGMPHVVAIAAPIGGGKSTLAQALAVALGEAGALAFDDYETATQMSPPQLQDWLANGAVFGDLQAPGLDVAFAALRRGETVLSPDGMPLRIARHLIFEMPLGRSWAATADLIDTLIWVDVPLDLALARRIREIVADLQRQEATRMRHGLGWLHDYLEQYATTVHQILDEQHRAIRPQADLCIDGSKPVQALVEEVVRFLNERQTP